MGIPLIEVWPVPKPLVEPVLEDTDSLQGEKFFDDADFVVEATEGDLSMATKDSDTLVSAGTGLLSLSTTVCSGWTEAGKAEAVATGTSDSSTREENQLVILVRRMPMTGCGESTV